jgi:hypothetical protein
VQPGLVGVCRFADTGLTEDRYVSAVEIREVNDQQWKNDGGEHGRRLSSSTIALMGVEVPGGTATPGGVAVHEVGRNADVFNPDSGKLLRAGSRVGFGNVHMHANGKDTTGHLEIAVQVPPERTTSRSSSSA